MTPLESMSNTTSEMLSSEYLSGWPSSSFAATVPTFVPPALFSGTLSELGGEVNVGAVLALTVTVAVAAAVETAPNASTTLKVKVASPLKPAAGSNTRSPSSSSARVTVFSRSPSAMGVPSSSSVPSVPAGSVTIRTSLSGSPSSSEKVKSDAANV